MIRFAMTAFLRRSVFAFLLILTAPSFAHAEKIIVVVKPVAPFVMEENGKFTGYSIDLWNEVARSAGWTDVEFRKVDTVPAMIDALKSGQADVAVGALSITSDRSKQIDFSHPFYDSGLAIMVKGGTNTGPMALLIRLLTPGLLIALVALVVVLIVVSHVLWLFERGKNPHEFPQTYRAGIIEALWWTTCVLIGGLSLNADPKGIIGRVIGAIWAVIGIGMISYFTATATAIMTVDSLSNEINGPRDLVGKPVATVQGSSASRYLKIQHLTPTEFPKVEDAIHALEQGLVKAVVYDAPVLMYYITEHPSKELRIVDHLFEKQKYGFGLQLGSKLRLPMNSALLGLAETDFLQKLDKLYFTPDEP